ncbi:MAG TPA: hypothetical protein V6D08_17235, partial [Candidatus Obscuribacterales bacterium]
VHKMKVKTDVAQVDLPPQTVVLVQTGEGAPTRVTALDLAGEEGLIVRAGPSLFVVMAAREELLIASRDLTPADLTHPDGVWRDYSPSKLDKDGFHVMKAQVSLDEMWAKNQLLLCRLEPIEKRKAFKRLRKPEFLATVGLDTTLPPPVSTSATAGATSPPPTAKWAKEKPAALEHHPRPFFMTTNTPAGSYFSEQKGEWRLVAYVPSGCPLDYHCGPGVNIAEVGPAQYYLSDGTVLLHPDRDVVIYTDNGDALIEAGSAAIISADVDITRVLNLSDHRPHGVHLVMNGQDAKLAPGYEASFTRGGKINARQLVLAQRLGRRDMRIMRMGENQYAVLNEFSVTDALIRHPLLQEARRSGAASDKRLIAEVQKTAAVISVSRDRTRGMYSSYGDIEYWGD